MAAPALHVSPLVGEPRTQAITLPVSPVSSEPRSPCPVRGCLSQAPESQDPTFWGGRGAGAVPGARVRPGTVGPGKAGLWGVRVRGTAARGGGPVSRKARRRAHRPPPLLCAGARPRRGVPLFPSAVRRPSCPAPAPATVTLPAYLPEDRRLPPPDRAGRAPELRGHPQVCPPPPRLRRRRGGGGWDRLE